MPGDHFELTYCAVAPRFYRNHPAGSAHPTGKVVIYAASKAWCRCCTALGQRYTKRATKNTRCAILQGDTSNKGAWQFWRLRGAMMKLSGYSSGTRRPPLRRQRDGCGRHGNLGGATGQDRPVPAGMRVGVRLGSVTRRRFSRCFVADRERKCCRPLRSDT